MQRWCLSVKQIYVVAVGILLLAAAGAFLSPPASVSGQAYKVVTRYAETCTETDGGDDPFGIGSAIITHNLGREETLDDFCMSVYIVHEYVCIGNTVFEKAYRCSSLSGEPNSRCYDGACSV